MVTKEDILQNIDKYYDEIDRNLEKELQEKIENELQRCGIMCRVFSRMKSRESIKQKIEKKAVEKYLAMNVKMQDLIGIRIVLYFKDDIDICIDILNNIYKMNNYEHDKFNTETFKPQRINYVFEIPDELNGIDQKIQKLCYIDNTFEVQIRTIFSEGWHEVEHDIRYKYLTDWKHEEGLSRELNGIFAVLEMCDNNIIAVCNDMAYCKYKQHKWDAMIRNKFRLKFQHTPIKKEIKQLLDNNAIDFGKEIFRFDRKSLIQLFYQTHLPKTYDNVIYLINAAELHDDKIYMLTPEIIKKRYNDCKFIKMN